MEFRRFAGCFKLAGYMVLSLVVTGALSNVWGILAVSLHVPFHRVLDRALLITLFSSVFLLEYRQFGTFWRWDSRVKTELLYGAFLAGASVAGAVMLGLLFGNWHLEAAAPSLSKWGQALLAMLLVPLLEETLFRGVSMGRLVQAIPVKGCNGMWVLSISAALYAAAHFVRIPPTFDSLPISWLSAWRAEGLAFWGLTGIVSVRFLNLWLIGIILGTLYWKTGRLWSSAAAHGIWVLALLLLPTWLQSNGGGTDLSATVWVTLPLTAIVVWLLKWASLVYS